jgi:hypothetical protein
MLRTMKRLFSVIILALPACTEAPVQSDDIAQYEQTLCSNVDGVPSAMAALAVSTATELGRWQPAVDFEVRSGALALTRVGKRQCEGGNCWNTQAILDLQRAPEGDVIIGDAALDARAFSRALVENYRQQQRCAVDADSGRHDGRGECSALPHQLALDSTSSGACDTIFTFHASGPSGKPLKNPSALAEKLVYVGYPENEYLSFTSTSSTVSIDPTWGLNDTGQTSTGACSAACMRISSSDLTGDCCSCGGVVRTFERAAFSASLYLCM